MARAVVTVAKGGLAVVDVTATKPGLGVHVAEATNGRGLAVTKSAYGLAVTYEPPRVGPELVTDGGFNSATGWTLTGGASIAGGHLLMDGSGTGNAVRAAAAALTAGKYQYEFDVVSTNGADVVLAYVGPVPSIVTGSNAPGHFVGTINTTAINQNLQLRTGVGVVCQLDNFSVKRLL